MAMTCSTSSSGTSVEDSTPNDEAALLARLQAQFGDMNVSSFLEGTSSTNPDRYPSGVNSGEAIPACGDDDESSLEEPSPEELRAWQEAQFQKGRLHLETKKIIESSRGENLHKSALQCRRQKKSAEHKRLIREYEESEESGDWEHLTPTCDLGGESSLFFPTNVDGANADNDGAEFQGLELAGGLHPLLRNLVHKGDPEVLGTKWMRLFSSAEGDGLSFRNLWNKLRGFDGPTVLLFGGTPSASRRLQSGSEGRRQERVSLGFFTTDSWTESPYFFGSDDDCFLFSLDYDSNDVQVLRPKSRSMSTLSTSGNTSSARSSKQKNHFMYCHPSSLPKTKQQRANVPNQTNGSVHGIGVGGTPSQPRLHITESLEECRALTYDKLFEDGDLLLGKGDESLYYFDVDCVEVWGVGGEEWISSAIKAQTQEREVHAASLDQARKVDKRQFLEDFENGVAWRSGNKPGLFGHRDMVDERDVCV